MSVAEGLRGYREDEKVVLPSAAVECFSGNHDHPALSCVKDTRYCLSFLHPWSLFLSLSNMVVCQKVMWLQRHLKLALILIREISSELWHFWISYNCFWRVSHQIAACRRAMGPVLALLPEPSAEGELSHGNGSALCLII